MKAFSDYGLRLVSILLLTWLAGCSTPTRPVADGNVSPFSTTMARGAHDAEGYAIADDLQRRYDDRSTSCESGQPSVACSGILLRATARGNYRVWNPNPNSAIPNGVSFSWLRKDVAFTHLVFGYSNGFTLKPMVSKGPYHVMCVYAFDADTFNRPGGSRDGCAANTFSSVNSMPCQAQQVFNSSQWLTKFRTVSNRYTDQCGFIVEEGTPDAALVFNAMAGIRAALPSDANIQNELMVGSWPQNDSRIPLEAFFFVNENSAGKAEARANQADFQTATGRWVPVVSIRMPTGLNAPATVTYRPADQQIP